MPPAQPPVSRANLSRLPQPAPLAPAAPVNPSTETYRYNVIGEFVIDASGRLTRKKGEAQVITAVNEELVGLGGGLLKAIRGEGDAAAMAVDDEEEIWAVQCMSGGREGMLHPSAVVDYSDI